MATPLDYSFCMFLLEVLDYCATAIRQLALAERTLAGDACGAVLLLLLMSIGASSCIACGHIDD
jgi:hypothetical protein